MKGLNCALFSINNTGATDWADLCIRFDAQTKVVAFSQAKENSPIIHCTPEMVKELIPLLIQGLNMVFPEPEPDAMTIMQQAQFPSIKDYLLPTERMRPFNPGVGQLTGFSFDPQPKDLKAPSLPEPDDDSRPNIGYIVRHEHKDAFFTSKSEDTRTCEGSRLDARIFHTRYEYIKATQGMKHGWTPLEVPIFYLVGRRESPQSPIYWYTQSDLTGTTVKRHATPLEYAAIQATINFFVPTGHAAVIETLEKRS